MINYMGAYWRSRDGTMHTFPAVYPRIQPLLLLELRSSRLLGGATRLGGEELRESQDIEMAFFYPSVRSFERLSSTVLRSEDSSGLGCLPERKSRG